MIYVKKLYKLYCNDTALFIYYFNDDAANIESNTRYAGRYH